MVTVGLKKFWVPGPRLLKSQDMFDPYKPSLGCYHPKFGGSPGQIVDQKFCHYGTLYLG